MKRKRLLLMTPIMPATAGNGLAMRAGMFLEALARVFDVSVLVVPVSVRRPNAAIPPFVRERSVRAAVLPIMGREDPHFGLIMRLKDPEERQRALEAYPMPLRCRFATPSLIREAHAAFPEEAFDIVHVMRLYLAPFAEPYLRQRPVRPLVTLDLDDIESRAHTRLADLNAGLGESRAERLQRAEARRFAAMERDQLRRFDRVFVCSQGDCLHLAQAYEGVRGEVIPNAAVVPYPRPARPDDPQFDCLFVGALRYGPNIDAVRHFCRCVLPELRSRMGRPVRAAIVGSDPPAEVRALAELDGVTVTGTVPDVRPYYAQAAAAVVPVRAGGGTRIKVLEAFAQGVPVVSTSIGCEGLDSAAGEHLLVADAPAEFAAACHRILTEPDLAARLSVNGWRLVRERYAMDAVCEGIGRLFAAASAAKESSDPA